MPAATVIVRAKDKEATIGRALASVRSQTVAAELIVVDSGSSDRTLAIACRYADRVIELPPKEFSYGRGLNLGAAQAASPVHVALSAHCHLPRRDWLERCLELYDRDDVAAVGVRHFGDGGPLTRGIFYQDRAHAEANPWWGLSNHASSWRADVWRTHRFDEGLPYAEDKEWALRVLAAGWVVAFDERLWVDMSHQWNSGLQERLRRERCAARAIASFAPHARYGFAELTAEWWHVPPGQPTWRRRLSPRRSAALGVKYQGFRAGRAASRST